MRDVRDITGDQAVLVLEMMVLEHMASNDCFGPDANGDGCTCFGLRAFGLHPELARGLLRSMKARGLVYHAIGLWSEDGEPRGSGYGPTRTGLERVKLWREGKITCTTFDPSLEFGGDGSVPF